MKKELHDKVAAFRTAVSVFAAMLKNGVISREEYEVLCTIAAEKFGLRSSTIFR